MTPEIVKVKIKMGDTEVELTLEEAKTLQHTLNDAFGSPALPVWVPYYDPWPYRPGQPFWQVITSGNTLCLSREEGSS
jgi:hypothetical protein